MECLEAFEASHSATQNVIDGMSEKILIALPVSARYHLLQQCAIILVTPINNFQRLDWSR